MPVHRPTTEPDRSRQAAPHRHHSVPTLYIEPLSPDDESLFVGLMTSPSTMRFAGGMWSRKRARRAFQYALKPWQGYELKQRIYSIRRGNDRPGILSATWTSTPNLRCELGILLALQGRQRGLAQQALSKLQRQLPTPERWVARVSRHNVAALRVFAALSFKITGIEKRPGHQLVLTAPCTPNRRFGERCVLGKPMPLQVVHKIS